MCEAHPLGCNQDRTRWSRSQSRAQARASLGAARTAGDDARREVRPPARPAAGSRTVVLRSTAGSSELPRRRLAVWDETQRAVDEALSELDGWLSGTSDGAAGRSDPYGLAPYLSRRWRPADKQLHAAVRAEADREIPAQYWRTISA